MGIHNNIVYGGRTIPCRPLQYDTDVLNDVFNAILPELAAECEWDMETDVDDINWARAKFIECVKSVGSTDGYEIMHNMELRHSWSGNATLVKIFDDAPFYKCLCEHVQMWIDYFKVEPIFTAGDVVTFQFEGKKRTGVIDFAERRSIPGRYVVSSVEGVEGRPLVRWEDCEKAS